MEREDVWSWNILRPTWLFWLRSKSKTAPYDNKELLGHLGRHNINLTYFFQMWYGAGHSNTWHFFRPLYTTTFLSTLTHFFVSTLYISTKTTPPILWSERKKFSYKLSLMYLNRDKNCIFSKRIKILQHFSFEDLKWKNC